MMLITNTKSFLVGQTNCGTLFHLVSNPRILSYVFYIDIYSI